MQSGNGTYLMDALMTLYGPNGQIIAQNDNFFGGDAFIATALPRTGEYVLEVRDARYIGNTKYVYCVEISDRPFAHAVFPSAVRRGEQSAAEISGHALGGLKQTTLSAAADEPIGWKTVAIQTPRGLTNPVSVLVSEHPQIIVPDGNRTAEQAVPLSLPTGVNGRFTAPEQTHYFSFEAKKGKTYRFEVESHRHGQLMCQDCVEVLWPPQIEGSAIESWRGFATL